MAHGEGDSGKHWMWGQLLACRRGSPTTPSISLPVGKWGHYPVPCFPPRMPGGPGEITQLTVNLKQQLAQGRSAVSGVLLNTDHKGACSAGVNHKDF